MKRKLLALIASTLALGIGAGTAMADSGAGQAQVIGQQASTNQDADADAKAKQNAVNANVPVSIAGGSITGGTSSANQTAANSANATAANKALTGQVAAASQTGGKSSCTHGCGGSGQFQAVGQKASTKQEADADADAKQNAVNANVPVSIAGGSITGGSSSANQVANNSADADASNAAATGQAAKAQQSGGGSSCKLGCGGSGQFQVVLQDAETKQDADADADAKQNAVNANVPVSIAGGDISGGTSSANQTATNSAGASAENKALTGQLAIASQTGGGSSCHSGCGGPGQFQAIGQKASTKQDADADADAKQNAVNANAPVSIAGGNVSGGSSSANQVADNSADADASNKALTLQIALADQSLGGCKNPCHDSCKTGCGGSGQFQAIGQWAGTKQDADADADAKQNAVNANTPVAVAGGNVTGGPSSANQTANNSADADAPNKAATIQKAAASQTGGGSSCKLGCGGSGQFQAISQGAWTGQHADADADAKQNAVNANAPVAIAGKDVTGGSSSANQVASNSADADASNKAATIQLAAASQTGGGSTCHLGCGGSGQAQKIGQWAGTWQDADADADAKQNAVNGNAPVAIAGGNVIGGSSSANQTASNSADADASNRAMTLQLALADQSAGGCKDPCTKPSKDKHHGSCGCGGSGQFQAVFQSAWTGQHADADADAKQNAVNSNAPVATAGKDVTGGSSSANQWASNSGTASSWNGSLTLQLAKAVQRL